MKNALCCTIIGLLSFTLKASAQTWTLVWSDEFNGSAISTTNWTYDTGGGGWGNNELEYYTDRSDNASIVDGALIIAAKKESYAGSSYTSARLKSQNLQSFKYGKMEASIKLPAGQGLWPAFWMLGNSITQAGWPACGEIDIMEHIDNAPSINGTMHWDNNGHAQYGGTTTCDVTRYHLYSIQWDANSIAWYLDGTQYWVGDIANNINSTDEFHAPFFIILNLAIGGSWPGAPDASTPFPDTMFVDYVRVYQLATTGVMETPDGTAKDFRLDQNYPNPFNPTTAVRYTVPVVALNLPKGSNGSTFPVTIKIYDLLGREVTTLVNETKVPGIYTVTWNAAGMPSGIYFCVLRTGEIRETKRMILLK